MDRKSPDQVAEPFQPSEEQKRLLPEVSGNTINGLSETAIRRPSPIYWHHPSKIAHGPVMKWMLEKTSREQPSVDRLHEKFGGRGPNERVPVAQTKVEDSAEEWTAKVKDFALANEADLVGITRLDPNWVFEDYEVSSPWIVILGISMDQPRLAAVYPEPGSVEEVMVAYNRGDRAAKKLADFIREQGWDADGHGGPIAGTITMIPAALACGFGELGKHGSIINRTYGSSFRLACVTTDLPLIPDPADTFGADDFCLSCQVCARACPPQAIAHEKQTVRGTAKWYVNFDKCVPYFNETYGCGICIAVCPWSRAGTAPKLAEKMTRRKADKS